MGNRGRSGIKPEKPLAWHRDQPGLDASSSTNRPPFTMSLTAPMRRRRRAKVRCGTGKTPGRWGGPLGPWHRNLALWGRGDVRPV